MDYHNVEVQRASSTSQCMGIDSSTAPLGQQIIEVACSQDSNSLWSWGNDGRIHAQADPSLCIQSTGYGNSAQLTLQSCSNNDTQKWSYDVAEYSIRNRLNARAAFDRFSNSNINIWGFHGGANQQWVITAP
ncbi:RICIN domain-containing protein [Alkalimarinus alittae]|nr:RICIN domain-containing protein [Alkalimarinus alittae]